MKIVKRDITVQYKHQRLECTVDPDAPIRALKVELSRLTNLPVAEIKIYYTGPNREFDDALSLRHYGLQFGGYFHMDQKKDDAVNPPKLKRHTSDDGTAYLPPNVPRSGKPKVKASSSSGDLRVLLSNNPKSSMVDDLERDYLREESRAQMQADQETRNAKAQIAARKFAKKQHQQKSKSPKRSSSNVNQKLDAEKQIMEKDRMEKQILEKEEAQRQAEAEKLQKQKELKAQKEKDDRRRRITVLTHDGITLELEFDQDDTIHHIQSKIAQQTHNNLLPIENQILQTLQRKVLSKNPHQTLHQAGIVDGATLLVKPARISVTIRAPDNKSVDILVAPTDTLAELKRQLADKVDDFDQQVLLNSGTEFIQNDDATLEDCGIHDGSVLDLQPNYISLKVKTPTGTPTEVQVASKDSVQVLRQKIKDATGLNMHHHILKHQGIELSPKSSATIQDLGFVDGTQLNVTPKSITVQVHTPRSGILSIKVQLEDTVQSIQQKIEDEMGLRIPQQVLKHNGRDLHSLVGLSDGSQLEVSVAKIPVKVNIPGGKQITFVIDPTQRLGDVKEMLAAATGVTIPADNQILSFAGRSGTVLSDDTKSVDAYGIQAGSVLDLTPKKITVKVRTTSKGAVVPVTVNYTDTAKDIKQQIEAQTGIKVPQQVLTHNNGKEPFSNFQTVQDLGLMDGSELQVTLAKLAIQVNTPNGKRVTLHVDPTDTVADIKQQLAGTAGISIPAVNQVLSMQGQELSNKTKSAQDYGMESGTILDLAPKSFGVHVKTPNGTTISVTVNSDNTALQIQQSIEAQTGLKVPEQELKYQGNPVSSNSTVQGLGLSEGSELVVETTKVPVKVNLPDGKQVTLQVDPTNNTIADIKRQLAGTPGVSIPVNDQILSMDDTELSHDGKPAKEYGVQSGSVLNLAPNKIIVTLHLDDGQHRKLEIDPSDDIGAIKTRIADVTGIAASNQILTTNNGNNLSGRNLDEMGLGDGSAIMVGVVKPTVKKQAKATTVPELSSPPVGLSRLEQLKLKQTEAKAAAARQSEKASRVAPLKRDSRYKKRDEKPKAELSIEKQRKCLMWYARLGQPSREQMIKSVAKMSACDIDESDVRSLPWIAGGALLPVKQMNDLFMAS